MRELRKLIENRRATFGVWGDGERVYLLIKVRFIEDMALGPEDLPKITSLALINPLDVKSIWYRREGLELYLLSDEGNSLFVYQAPDAEEVAQVLIDSRMEGEW